MPCGCAERRKAIKDAWMRLVGKSVMLSGDRQAQARAEAEAQVRRQQMTSPSWAQRKQQDARP
jgi:hypothetical protein